MILVSRYQYWEDEYEPSPFAMDNRKKKKPRGYVKYEGLVIQDYKFFKVLDIKNDWLYIQELNKTETVPEYSAVSTLEPGDKLIGKIMHRRIKPEGVIPKIYYSILEEYNPYGAYEKFNVH